MRLIVKLLLCSIAFFSCTRVIDLKLRDSEIKYVIEGVVTNESGSSKVYLHRSRNFNEDNRFEGVSGAIVKVKDNGVEFLLPENQPGVYETDLVRGTPGHLYELSVFVNGQNFTASCTMPMPVLIDTLYISRGPFGQFRFATVTYRDPPGINNAYRFVQYVNAVKEPSIFWENDEFTDGQPVTIQLDGGVDEQDDPRNIKTGDEVTVEMLCLDEPVYRFWYTLRAGGGDGDRNTAAPANPLTNIQGGAIGYFSAHTVSRKKIITP